MRAFLPPVRGRECARPRAVDESCPASGRRRGNSPAGERELSAHGAGTTHGLCPRWECTPHSLFSVLPEKRECAVHGGREKRSFGLPPVALHSRSDWRKLEHALDAWTSFSSRASRMAGPVWAGLLLIPSGRPWPVAQARRKAWMAVNSAFSCRLTGEVRALTIFQQVINAYHNLPVRRFLPVTNIIRIQPLHKSDKYKLSIFFFFFFFFRFAAHPSSLCNSASLTTPQ